MNIFDYEGKEFDKKLDEIFKNKSKEELKQELIECGLEINNSNRLKYLMKKIDKIVENVSIEEIEERIKVDEMEEDFKVLEHLINYLKKKRENPYAVLNENFVEWDGVFLELNYVINSLENLIKGYKDLEECLKAEEKYAEGLNNDIKSLLNIEPNNNFIPKSKVREVLDTKYIAMFEGDTEFPDDATIMKTVKYVKVSDIEELLQKGDTNATKM